MYSMQALIVYIASGLGISNQGVGYGRTLSKYIIPLKSAVPETSNK